MNNLYLAKSRPEQTVQEHTEDLLKNYECFCKIYPDAYAMVDKRIVAAIKLAAIYHDLGKINSRFQNMIYTSLGYLLLPDELSKIYQKYAIEQIPHGMLSVAFFDVEKLCELLSEDLALATMQAVYYHHERELLSNVEKMHELIEKVINDDITKQTRNFAFPYIQGPLRTSTDFYSCPFPDDARTAERQWILFAIIKGMLNRLDYAASAGLPPQSFEIPHKIGGVSLPDTIKNHFFDQLRPVQEYMSQNSDKNLVVVASTGIGKTEAALLWIGEHKGFYTLPLKVSINAIYDRIRKQNKDCYGYQSVELLHSDALTRYLEESEHRDRDPFQRHKQARLFANPLTICTVDQLFKFVFKYNGCEPMLATLGYSRVIIDEIQMYSPDVTAAILYGLKLIQDAGGKFSIITATMPAILLDKMKELKICFDMPEQPFLSDLQRHKIELISGEMDIERILNEGRTKKVLVIINTVRKAQEVYQALCDSQMQNKSSIKLLHSNFIKKHRVMLEKSIFDFTNHETFIGIPGVWVTTQVVEASLDVDFDMLFSEMCTADSLLQRMGRCYRKREYEEERPNVIIYDNKNGRGKIYDKDIYQASLEQLKKYCGAIFTEQMKFEYIHSVYDSKFNPTLKTSRYYQDLDKRLREFIGVIPFFMTREDAEAKFRNLKSVTLMPESIYRERQIAGNIERWTTLLTDKKVSIKEKIAAETDMLNYTVNISNPAFNFDRAEMIEKSGVHRCTKKYEFNEGALSGRGLLRSEEDDENRFDR